MQKNNSQKIVKFMSRIESIYGRYERPDLKKLVTAFILKNWPESEYDNLFGVLLKKYPTHFKTQPDITIFNELWEEAYSPEHAAEKAWDELLSIKSVRSILCTDIIVQETIKNMGGIDEFIRYRDVSNHWGKDDFIKTYCRLARYDWTRDRKIDIIKCEHDLRYRSDPRYLKLFPERMYEEVLIIGDQEIGKRRLEDIKQTQKQIGFGVKHQNKIEFEQDNTRSIGDILSGVIK